MSQRASLLIMVSTIAGGSVQASSLADLFSGPTPARLKVDTIKAHFAPTFVIEDFSRDACFPVLKATPASTEPVAASFIGTTLHHPCDQPQSIVIIKLQIRSDTSYTDARALAASLSMLNGRPCYQGTTGGHASTVWSDNDRVIGVSDGIDQGSGYTITLFSRAALTPPKDEADTQAYRLWDSSAPPSCRMPTPR